MSKRLQVLVPEALDRRIRKAAQRSRLSAGAWVRHAVSGIRAWLLLGIAATLCFTGSAALATHGDKSCQPVATPGCGELDVQVAGVIYSENSFRADTVSSMSLALPPQRSQRPQGPCSSPK